ncbi:UDP-N-acetylmuramoyl-L-alanyl-D-glutamate--2,6-diaminopimelate ligase [Candidatus Dependentiae bacterium]|nr:UDP-N-acetylmuramoyl-L-alanyl-D-glutamate--2,6-diaminopimelate ligase [Candidatus Dependentiae bacterium]
MHSLAHTPFKVAAHTDNVGPGSTFVAIPGRKKSGTAFIAQAVAKGARTVVVENTVLLDDAIVRLCTDAAVTIVTVDNARAALARLSAEAYGFPARRLKIIGVTGTKGKTTTTFLIRHVLQATGHTVAMLSGVYNCIGTTRFVADLTTPQPDYLHHFFAACVEQGIEYLVMEAAAQAFSLHRLDGIFFAGIVLTNFSREHAEFYSSMEEYFAAKKEIMAHAAPGAAVCINADDPWLQQLIVDNPAVITFGTAPQATFRLLQYSADMRAIAMTIEHTIHSYHLVTEQLVGSFNVMNILGAIACLHTLGISLAAIASALQSLPGIPGRLERYLLAHDVIGIVDYAHNPSSFAALLATVRPATKQLIVVFGCGGDRDPGKRPMMGSIAEQYADCIVLTTDNPRSEPVEDITAAILQGISAREDVIIAYDRSDAIAIAVAQAKPGAIVAVLGKGPDEYQEVAGVKTFFSDSKELQRFA